jgi:hypothetical protein
MPKITRHPTGPTPETNLQSVWAGKGQHRSTTQNDHSAKAGKAYEVIVAYTIQDRHPIYKNCDCPYCNAPVRWTPISRAGNLVPICVSCRRVVDFSIKTTEYTPSPVAPALTPVQEAIRERQWAALMNRSRC